jgi:hypothetical protein
MGLKKNRGTGPGLMMRDLVPIEVRIWGGAGYWPCPRLALMRLTGSPAAFDGSGCAVGLESEGRWSQQRYVRARRPTLRQEAAVASKTLRI